MIVFLVLFRFYLKKLIVYPINQYAKSLRLEGFEPPTLRSGVECAAVAP